MESHLWCKKHISQWSLTYNFKKLCCLHFIVYMFNNFEKISSCTQYKAMTLHLLAIISLSFIHFKWILCFGDFDQIHFYQNKDMYLVVNLWIPFFLFHENHSKWNSLFVKRNSCALQNKKRELSFKFWQDTAVKISWFFFLLYWFWQKDCAAMLCMNKKIQTKDSYHQQVILFVHNLFYFRKLITDWIYPLYKWYIQSECSVCI